jgi:glycosyltransferase involved in cell wall biosynthesis
MDSGIEAERVRVIRNGVSPAGRKPAWRGVVNDETPAATPRRARVGGGRAKRVEGATLTTVGRLHPVKNFDGLITAMRLLPPETRLEIWGEGADRARLSALIENLGLKERVALRGESDTMTQALAAADIYIQPSKSEGCSFTVAEAMLHGLPVVVTPCGGLPEQVEDGVSGMVTSDCSPEGLAAAISTLLGDADLAERLAKAGEKAAEAAHSMDSWLEQTTTAFLDAARGGDALHFRG